MATIAAATVAMATTRRRTPASLLTRHHQSKPSTWKLLSRLTPFASQSSSSSSSSSYGGGERKLVLYSKPGCCLCDGLKEKLTAAFSLCSSLNDVVLQAPPALSPLVRDIRSNPEWERAYEYEIPVLAKVLPDGSEKILPRISPRLGVEVVRKKISSAFLE